MLSRFSRPSTVRIVVAALLASNLALPRVAQAAPVTAVELAQIDGAVKAFYSGATARVTSPRWQSATSALEASARAITAPGFLRGDGSWSDINYADVPSGVWSPWEHTRRISTMTRAYVTPGQALYRDAALLRAIDVAFAYSLTFYNASTPTPGNWWFWRIGVPLDLAPSLLLVRDELTPSTVDGVTKAIRAKVGPSSFYYPPGTLLKGENLVWSAQIHLALAVLQNDTAMMADVRDAMSTATAMSSGDGLKADFTFQQHGAQLYTGGYGGAFANEVSKYLLFTRGTSAQLPDDRLQLFANYMAEGVMWALYQKHWDPSVMGREAVRSTSTGYHGIASLLQMSGGNAPRQKEIDAAAAQMLRSWDWTLPTELAAIASRLETAGVAPAWPSGHRDYRVSDYVVHRRANYFASIKMLSSRTKSGENTNGENLLGSRQSDGRFHLALRGDEYYEGDVMPALDWSRLPGITVEQNGSAANDQYAMGTRSFVGGTGDGRNGVAAMDFAAIGSSLTAKKAWVFFDDAIVFLNNSITALSANRVETVVEQWPLSNSAAPLVVDGAAQPTAGTWSATLESPRWAFADGVGYFFPEPLAVNAKREQRSGTWAKLGAGGSDANVSHPMLTLWIDHGTNVANASASYVIVPGITAAAMQQWAASSPIRIVANDARVSAARDERSGATGFVFWQASSLEGVTTDSPAVVYMTRGRNRLVLSAADPRQSSGAMKITLAEPLTLVSAPAGVTIARTLRTTTLTIPRNGGATSQIELATAARQRSVRR